MFEGVLLSPYWHKQYGYTYEDYEYFDVDIKITKPIIKKELKNKKPCKNMRRK